MKQLTALLERTAIAVNLKRVNWWLRLLLALIFLGFVVAMFAGDYRAIPR